MFVATSAIAGGRDAQVIPAPQSLTFVGVSFSSTNLNIQVPSGTQAGDIAIAYSSAVGSTPSVYSGFTEITSVNSTFDDMFQYKKLTSADLTTTFTRSATSYDAAIMMTFRPDLPVNSLAVTSVNNSGQTTGTPSTQILSTSAGNGPSILIGTYSSYGSEPSINGSFWDGNYLKTGENNNQIKMYYQTKSDGNSTSAVQASGDYGNYNVMMSCVINAS